MNKTRFTWSLSFPAIFVLPLRPERGEELSGGRILRLIQICDIFAPPASIGKYCALSAPDRTPDSGVGVLSSRYACQDDGRARGLALAEGKEKPETQHIREAGAELSPKGKERQIKALIEKLRGIKKALPDAIS